MITSGIIGIVLGVLLEDPIKGVYSSIIKACRRRYYKLFPARDLHSSAFFFGGRETSVTVIDGNGRALYDPKNIVCIVVPKPQAQVSAVDYWYSKLSDDHDRQADGGGFTTWDGLLFSLLKFDISRTAGDENPVLRLYVYQTHYSLVSAVINNLDREVPTQTEKLSDYIDNFKFRPMEPYILPNGIGVAATVITRDNKIVFVRRSERSGFRPGESDISIVEGLFPREDHTHQGINFRDVFSRGFNEEICEIDQEADELDISILGLVFDRKYNQWNIIGTISSSLTQEEIISRHNSGTLGKWELSRLDFVDFSIRDVLLYCSSHEMWDMALVDLYFSLVFHGHSKKKIDAQIARHYHKLDRRAIRQEGVGSGKVN